MPQGAYQEEDTPVIQTSRLFRTGASRTSTDIRSAANRPEIGANSPHTWVDLDASIGNGDLPLLEMAFAPQDADLKIGPVYFDLLALSAATLYTDNANQSEDDPQSQTGLYLRMTGRVIAQLTEGLRLAATGSIVYLPLENKVGPDFLLPYGVPLPSIKTELSWDTMVGNWNALFFDVLSSGYAHSSSSSTGSLDTFNGSLDEENENSQLYRFRDPREAGVLNSDESNQSDTFFFSNKIGAETERLWPGSMRLKVRAFHENLWYNQGYRGLPTLRQEVRTRLQSEKESTRFKPFASYRATRTDGTDERYGTDGLNQEARAGVDGPLTENIQLHLDGGVHHCGQNGRNDPVYALGLVHLAGPYTQQSLWADRHAVGLIEDELQDRVIYTLRQSLGPKLNATLFASVQRSEDLEGVYGDRKEARAGIQLQYRPGEKTTFTLRGVQTAGKSDRDDLGNYNTTAGHFEWTYRLTTDLFSKFIYQYEQRDSDRSGDSFTENTVFLSITRYFQ